MKNFQYGDVCSVESGMTVTAVLLILLLVSLLGAVLAFTLYKNAHAKLKAARAADPFAYTREQYLREQNGIIGGSAEEIAAHQPTSSVDVPSSQ